MYDLNFFSAPLKTTRRSPAILIGILMIVFAVGAVGAFYVWQQVRARAIREDIRSMETYLGSEPVKSQLAELEVVKQQTQLLQNYQTTFDVIRGYVRNSRLVSTELMARLASTLPKNVSFASMTVMNMEVQIEAHAPANLPVAELLFNLKQTGMFTTVDLVSIAMIEAEKPAATEPGATPSPTPTPVPGTVPLPEEGQMIKVRAVLKEVVLP